MKTVQTMDILDGKMTFVFMPESKLTLGKFDIYIDDTLHTFTAMATCLELDTFDIQTGKDIVALKLQQKYFSRMKAITNKKKRKLQQQMKTLESVDYDKKLYGVNSRLHFHMK